MRQDPRSIPLRAAPPFPGLLARPRAEAGRATPTEPWHSPPHSRARMKAVDGFARLKQEGRKISMVTAYDAWSARLVARSNVDAILVGDSAAMVMHGHPTTLAATVELMALHTRAVATAAAGKFVIADLPFLSFRKGIPAAMEAVGALVTSGAQAVKLEGVAGHEDVIGHIVESGVPVMGHIGLTPQSINRFGGFRVQGKTEDAAATLTRQEHVCWKASAASRSCSSACRRSSPPGSPRS